MKCLQTEHSQSMSCLLHLLQTGEIDYDAMMDSDEDQGQHDAYLERMKAEGRDRDSDALDDDSDSSGIVFDKRF